MTKLSFIPGVKTPFSLFIFGSIFISTALTQEFEGQRDEGFVMDEIDDMENALGRHGKFLSWPAFPRFGNVLTGTFNSRCVKEDGDNLRERHGICMPRSKCEKMGATDSGSSCEKFGLTCCIFNATCDRSKETITVKRDLVYITHKQNEQECLTDYKFPRQNNVCQLRLEFKIFKLSPPNNLSGNCLNDKMTIRKAENLPTNMVLCGRSNESDHLHLHYGESNEIVINLDVAQQSNVGDVEILVQQIKCNSADLAPEGCTQYFTQQRGDVRSFNFDRLNGQHLNNHVYAVCVKGSEGSSSVTWNPCNGADDFEITSIHSADVIATAACPTDSVTIPGSIKTKLCTKGTFADIITFAKPYAMYVNFNAIEQIPIPPPVGPVVPGMTCPPGWIVDTANAGQCIPNPDQVGNNISDIFNRGFCLRYQRI